MWNRRWKIEYLLLILKAVELLAPQSRVSAAEDGTNDLTVAQCVLTLGAYDTNQDQRINRTEFADVVEELCSFSASSAISDEIWGTVFLEAACLCRSFDNNTAASEDCCSVNPVIRRPGQYAKEYTIAVCSLLYEQFARSNCIASSNNGSATESPSAAPIASIISTTDAPEIRSPTMAPSLSTGNVAILGTSSDNDETLEPWMLALLVLLAATSTVLLIWTLQRFSFCSHSFSVSNRSLATTVAKGSVQICKSSDDDVDDEAKLKRKKKVVVVVVNDPTTLSSSSYDDNDDEERAQSLKESASGCSFASKTTTPTKNYYVDTDHDLMYASHQYFSSPTTTSTTQNRPNPLLEDAEDEGNNDVILDDDSSSSSSASDPFHVAQSQSSSSSSSSTSSQGDASSMAALLSEPLPMSAIFDDASLATEEHRRPSTIQTNVYEDPGSDLGSASVLLNPALNPGITTGRSLASGAATLHISPSLPDYGIVQFTEFPSSSDALVDVDDQTVVVSNRPLNGSSNIEEGWPEENACAVPFDIVQPTRKGRTVTKQRTRPLPAHV